MRGGLNKFPLRDALSCDAFFCKADICLACFVFSAGPGPYYFYSCTSSKSLFRDLRRSEFMHTLLVGPFAEAEKAEINISDVDPPVFRELLPKLDLTPS